MMEVQSVVQELRALGAKIGAHPDAPVRSEDVAIGVALIAKAMGLIADRVDQLENAVHHPDGT